MKLIFFGDSICFGQGVSLHKGWVPRISQELAYLAEELGQEITVFNSAVNGRTTRQALETMPYEVQSQRPEILVVQFGMNDCNYWQTDEGLPRVAPEAFKANLHEIIRRGHNFGTGLVILNTNHPTCRNHAILPGGRLTYEESNRHYNALIREVDEEAGPRVILNDVERAFSECLECGTNILSNLLLDDCLHLSEQGHDLYFETNFPAIKGAVTQLIESEVRL